MDKLNRLATRFRKAIDAACESGEFRNDIAFRNFPRGCCGDASDLLSEFLMRNKINPYYVCGTYYGDFDRIQSHAWLTIGEIVIDITGDQFKYYDTFFNYDKPVYVGKENDFYGLFEVEERDIRKSCEVNIDDGMCSARLRKLYSIIEKYL